VKGKETIHIHNQDRTRVNHNKVYATIDLTAGNFIVKPNEIHQVVLGKVKDFKVLPNLWMMCKNEGFLDVAIRYVGGVWVLIEFLNAKTCNNFKANGVVKEWFLEITPWDRNFVNKERLVWLDVEGVPLRARSKSTFTKILAKWGDIMIMSNDLGENLYSNRVGVLTGFNDIISEVVQAKVDGIVF